MILTRLSIILVICLLFFNKSEAQTDSTLPPPVQQPVRVQDTTGSFAKLRHDSVARVRREAVARMRRDSLAGFRRDSIARAARDSPVAPMTGVRNAASPPPVYPYPPLPDMWQKVLSGDTMIDFTGQPVAETFETHNANSKDSLFYLIVAIMFYFGLIRIFFEKYLDNLMTLFFRVSLRQQQIREQVLQTPLPSLLLNILFIVSAGLYACFLLHYSRLGAGVGFWALYLYCMALLAAIYLVKYMVLKFIGWVFSISRATDIYIFVVFMVNKMLGIFLLPFLIVIIFSGQDWREVFITISLAMIFVLWGYRILASYRPVRNEIKLTPFYFFLYLCAFELAPLLLIYKVLLTYLEKVY